MLGRSVPRLPSVAKLLRGGVRWLASAAREEEKFPVQPGSLLHICCTQPHTHVQLGNTPGVEDTVTLQAQQQGGHGASQPQASLRERFLVSNTSGQLIDIVEQPPSSSSGDAAQRLVLSGTIPSRFCGLGVSTAGGSVTVGQLQEADMQLSTAGGDVRVVRCRANNASINTAAATAVPVEQPQQQQQELPADTADAGSSSGCRGGSIQVGELSASRVWVYSGGAAVHIKRLFGLSVEVLAGGGQLSIGAVYADRAAISSTTPAAALRQQEQQQQQQPSRAERAAAATAIAGEAGGGAGGGVGGVHIEHIACLKGEARLESGGGPLRVDGLEGNAVLLSNGGDIKVHLHEQAGLVYVDSGGGSVTAWLSPQGGPLGLQVKAAGGVGLDPALKVTGEIGPTMLFGVTAGDGSISSMSSQTSDMVQQAVEAARASTGAGENILQAAVAFDRSGGSPVAGGGGAEAARWKANAQQVAAWSQASALQEKAAAAIAAAQAEGGCGCRGSSSGSRGGGSSAGAAATSTRRQLIINAGWGRVELKAMGWMDGLKARMLQQQGQDSGSSAH